MTRKMNILRSRVRRFESCRGARRVNRRDTTELSPSHRDLFRSARPCGCRRRVAQWVWPSVASQSTWGFQSLSRRWDSPSTPTREARRTPGCHSGWARRQDRTVRRTARVGRRVPRPTPIGRRRTPRRPARAAVRPDLVHHGFRVLGVDHGVARQLAVDEVDAHRPGEWFVHAAEELHIPGVDRSLDVAEPGRCVADLVEGVVAVLRPLGQSAGEHERDGRDDRRGCADGGVAPARHDSAVVGSMMLCTAWTASAGKPPRRACSTTASASVAM